MQNPIDKILATERVRTSLAARRQLETLKTVVRDIEESVSELERVVDGIVGTSEDKPDSSSVKSALEGVKTQISRLEIVKVGLVELTKMSRVLMSGVAEKLDALNKGRAARSERLDPKMSDQPSTSDAGEEGEGGE